MDGNDITLCLYAFLDEGLSPLQIANLSIDFTGADAGRKHNHLIITVENAVNLLREAARLTSKFIDAYTKRSQPLQIQKQVIDKVLDMTIVFGADDTTESNAVNTAKRMIRDKSETSFLGQLVQALYRKCHAQIFNTFSAEVNADMAATQELIDKILVNDALQPTNYKTGNTLACSLPNNTLKVDSHFVVFRHCTGFEATSSINRELAIIDEICALGESRQPIGTL